MRKLCKSRVSAVALHTHTHTHTHTDSYLKEKRGVVND